MEKRPLLYLWERDLVKNLVLCFVHFLGMQWNVVAQVSLLYRERINDLPRMAMVIPRPISKDPIVTARHACHKQADVTRPSVRKLAHGTLPEPPPPPYIPPDSSSPEN